jgi:hypothetical protein
MKITFSFLLGIVGNDERRLKLKIELLLLTTEQLVSFRRFSALPFPLKFVTLLLKKCVDFENKLQRLQK